MKAEQKALIELYRHRLKLIQDIEYCERHFGDAPEIRTLKDALKHIDELIANTDSAPQPDN